MSLKKKLVVVKINPKISMSMIHVTQDIFLCLDVEAKMIYIPIKIITLLSKFESICCLIDAIKITHLCRASG